MKKFRRFLWIFSVILAFMFLGCDDSNMALDGEGNFVIDLDLGVLEKAGIEIDEVKVILSYVDGDLDPIEKSEKIKTGDESVSFPFENIRVGTWTVTITLYDKKGIAIGFGEQNVNILEGMNDPINITVEIIKTGNIEINVYWKL